MRALREKVVGLALQIAKGSTHGAALLGMGTCAGAPTRLAEMLPPTLGQAGLRGATDPTVRGARLFPEHLDDTHGWGTDAGGGLRSIVGGVRLVSMPDGAIAVARDRLPATPSCVAVLPIRLGGGFLFGIGPRLWRATTWLGRADGLFTSSAPVAEILIGLDRVYLRGARGSLLGLDPLTGTPLGLGPLPQSPAIGRLAAIDAWRAVAIADLRGAMITLDAGSTWRPLPLPIEPTHVVALRDSIAIGGFDRNHQVEWWDVTTDGVLGRFSSAEPRSGEPAQPVANPGPSALAGPPTRRTLNSATRSFGLLPLKSAIEDGWPLSDGTALVARDGTLARVQLTDGALVEAVADAFPLKPARCHGISLASAREPGDFGFVCGEPLGATIVYRWDAASARLAELHRFGTPREVLAFGNGALGVRGPCASSTPGDGAGDTGATGSEQAWCLMAPGAAWQERRFPVDARLVVLSDGRVVLVQPPRGGDLASARLTIIDGPRVSEVPIVPSPLRSEVAPALRTGIWMDGFEERRPGVVGGWIDAAGSIVGIEIAASGEARVGEYIRDAGAAIASGRWAFGWTASRRGFETTDGGMTWEKELALPDPIATGRAIDERACGPIGCLAAGWLRVGWGASDRDGADEPPPMRPSHRARRAPNLELECTPSEPPGPSAPDGRPPAATGSGGAWGTVSELPPFAGTSAPPMPADNLGLSLEASGGPERLLRALPVGRIYAWGPKTGEWDPLGRWQVRWQWPWGGWREVRSTQTSRAPWNTLDAGRHSLGIGPGTPVAWIVAPGDDPDDALLITRRGSGTVAVDLVVLRSGHRPFDARRPNGEAFADIEGTAHMGSRWYVATMQDPGETAATILWSVEGTTVRELARVPRAALESRPAFRLARHSDGRSIGLVVDGQPEELGGTSMRWVAAVDVDSGTLAAPEPLAPTDLSDRSVSLCTGDDTGWGVELPYPGAIRLSVGARWEATLDGAVAQIRLLPDRACVERVLGSVDGYAASPAAALTQPPPRAPDAVRTIDASVFSARTRYALRCANRTAAP